MPEPSVIDLFNLSGRAALITGGAGYLGSALACALAEAGASVIISSRKQQRAEAAAKDLPLVGGAAHHGIELDHKREESIQRGFETALKLTGHIDLLVNNGQSGPAEDCQSASTSGFQDHLANLIGCFQLSRCLRDHAVARAGTASVVMMGSMYGVVGSYPDAYEGVCTASPVAYHALKGGIVQLTRHLAVYWARDGIRVNCLSPGPFPNPDTAPAQMVQRLELKSPMRRMGLPHELKGALLLLCSEAGSYITGQNLIVDGGWTAW